MTLKLGILSSLVFASACTDELAESKPPPAPESSAQAICGDNTVASARAVSGNRVVFCVEDDLELIAEGGSAEHMPAELDACALDLFLALTDAATPVPARLVDSCARRTGSWPLVARTIVDAPVFAASPLDDATWFSSGSVSGNYCDSTGTSRFVGDRCLDFCGSNQYCASWCLDLNYPTTIDSWDMLGEQVNHAVSYLASCDGTTTFSGWRDRGAVDDGYQRLYAVSVFAGTTWQISMSYTPSNGQDAHFRYWPYPKTGARYLTSGYFLDNK